MKASALVQELITYILEHGDREIITAQRLSDGDYTYGDTRTGIVDYGEGTIGLVGYREENK